jgi:hypothetical protein
MTEAKNTRAFWDLRDAPLHLYGPEEWKTYDPAMAAWLLHTDQQIRHCAIERLAMAVLHWDYEQSPRAAGKNQVTATRVAWLLEQIETAHHQWPDVIPAFLTNLRYHGDDPHIAPQLLRWIDIISTWPQPPDGEGRIRGTIIMLTQRQPVTPDHLMHWISLLDAPWPYLRGCAAYQLGNAWDEDDADLEAHERLPISQSLWDLIGNKELERPGIAGPFWAPRYDFDCGTPERRMKRILWMMDLLERRQGPVPSLDDMGFNDIEFYLHELCCDLPDMMQRMLDGGFTALACMTATEVHGVVAGVEPILKKLADDANPSIAAAARAHLGRYYTLPETH